MIFVRSTVLGAGQFSAAAAIVSFTEMTDINAMSPNMSARIMGYSYNSQGAANDAVLVMAPSAAAAADQQIVLENLTGINNFTSACGPGGIVVPRVFGVVNGSSFTSGATYVVLFSTTGKAGDGTFTLWYAIGDVDSTHD